MAQRSFSNNYNRLLCGEGRDRDPGDSDHPYSAAPPRKTLVEPFNHVDANSETLDSFSSTFSDVFHTFVQLPGEDKSATKQPLSQKQRVSMSSNRAPQLAQTQRFECQKINPNRGRPCATTFTRIYDLSRHDATVHNPKKEVFKCWNCTKVPDFSRRDGLMRHTRVVHPDVKVEAKAKAKVGMTGRKSKGL